MLNGYVRFVHGSDQKEYEVDSDVFTEPFEVDCALSEWASKFDKMYGVLEDYCVADVLFRAVGSTDEKRFSIWKKMIPEYEVVEED